MPMQKFIEVSKSFFIDHDYQKGFADLGLTSIDAVFSFSNAENLNKANLAGYRSRLKFQINSPLTTAFLKRYNKPPVTIQLINWLTHHRKQSFAFFEFELADKLASAGINTPQTICYGEQWNLLFEKRSFIITAKIPDAESIERKLPDCFNEPTADKNFKLRREFITRSAFFVKKFHQTGFRHRDLYLSHIFYSSSGQFYLLDLARVFKPILLKERFLIKDIAQLYYSAPKRFFSGTDRLRFYHILSGSGRLNTKDKRFIRKVINKVQQMARHDVKHGRIAPFAG